MKHILIINTHEAYPFSKGDLNRALVDKMQTHLSDLGYQVRLSVVQDGFDVQEELEKHRWADIVILQIPVNWMGVPWRFKQYQDFVYSAAMDGTLCDGDGRSREDASRHYGSGGTMSGKRYMLSLTFNAPAEAFNDPEQYLFQGKSVDDLFFPTHMNFRFFNMTALETFACYDVMKNPTIEHDFLRLEKHLDQQLANVVA